MVLERGRRQESLAKIPLENNEHQQLLSEGIADPDDAQDMIDALVAEGYRPKITVPKKYLDQVLKHGCLLARQTWIPNLSLLVGTIGINPYSLSSEGERVVFEIANPGISFKPRFSGKDKKFHGVVFFPEGRVELKDLKRVN